MKTFAYTLLALCALLMPVNALAAQGIARITLVEGDVQMRMADSDDWVPVAINTPVEVGDSVWSPEGARSEIQLTDGTYIRLDRNSSLDFLDASDDSVQFHLGMGHAYVRTGTANRSYQFDLTESTVSVSHKARIRLDITADGDEDISVIKGTAYVEAYGARTNVRSGEMMSLEESRSELLPLKVADEWETWNRERDRSLQAAARDGNLPGELAIYDDELSRSGEWVSTPEYGRVWRPTVIVTNDWAPYRVGRWVWRGGDYVWISYEDWGWAPYHYGRWAIVPRWGWCWVPPPPGQVFWAPAYVGWVNTPRYVGWVPLAPGERYYGRGYYGRASVNINNVTNIRTGITRVTYVNQQRTANAATVVTRDAFAAGRLNAVKPKENIFARGRATISRPAPPPSRAIRMPLVKPIPAAKLPPPKVARVPASELRQRLPRLERPPVATPPAGVGAGAPGREGALRQTPVQPHAAQPQVQPQRPSPPTAGSAPARPARRMPGVLAPPASPPGAAGPRSTAPRPEAARQHPQRTPRKVWEVRPRGEGKPAAQPGQPSR